MTKRNLYVFILVFPALLQTVYGQVNANWPNQEDMFFTVNPAMTADARSLSIGIAHGRRWNKIKSSPSQSSLAARVPFRNQKMAIGAHVFSDKVGPLAGNGIDLAYAYRFSTGLSRQDGLSLGMSIRFMQISFDRSHLLASREDDPLFDNVDPKKVVPPSLNIGFKYATGATDYYNPVQMIFAASVDRFLPFEDRFNSLSIDHTLQWNGMIALNIAASQTISLAPSLLMSNSDQSVFNYAFRLKTTFKNQGWLMTQISKAGFLTTQIGFKLGESQQTGSVFSLSASNSWYFGTLATQLGNSTTFGLCYSQPIR
ncbi:MAG: PorP/SprF family type IX secretion system membrane protein [Saprospiraceae bacterium]|nr:PorP/SprF family type IX secretion system membrane protein [Saprospiraceae bacterium]